MRTLLRSLWSATDRPGAITFWLSPSKESIHVPLRQLAELDDGDERDFAQTVGEENVYFGLGLRQGGLDGRRQGGKKEIIALPAFALDIDFSNPKAHVAKNLPKDLDEASAIISHLPDPSAVVHTGNGAHVYWIFREAIDLDSVSRQTLAQKAYKTFQTPLIERAFNLGWHLDNTASIQRVWRVPGFLNKKTDKLVELIYCDDSVRYEPEDLGVSLPRRREKKTPIKNPVPSVAVPKVLKKNPYLLEQIRERLEATGPTNKFHKAVKAALAGKSMADAGARDEVLQGVCSTIAWMPEGRDADPEALAEILRPSLDIWASEDGAKRSIEEEIEKAVDKIRRSQEDYKTRQEQSRPQLAGIARALGVSLETEEGGEKRPNDYFLKHSLIQYRDSYYVYDFRIEGYTLPKTQKEVKPLARDAWADGPDDLDIEYEDDKGKIKTKTMDALSHAYCTNVDHVIGEMTMDESRYDSKSRTFFEAIAKKRVTEARFDPLIDTWLRLLAGDKVLSDGRIIYDVVIDWVAGVPKLNRQNSALYLGGASGAGKGLLTNGLARIWRQGPPTEFENIAGSFNDEIAKCPLLRIDEGLEGKQKDLTKKLRSVIGRQSFTLNEKFLAPRIVNGAVRLVICANNDNVLMVGDTEYSQADLEAIVGRILHVRAQQAAADWLEEHNRSNRLTNEWVEGDRIAMHCLWLHQNRTIVEGKRFLVEGAETEMHRQMIMQGDTNGLVYEWLVRFASHPDPLLDRFRKTPGKQALAWIGNGELLVNADCVIACWDVYMPALDKPKSTRISKVLRDLSARTRRLGPRTDRNRFHVIKPDLVVEWSRRHQIGNEDKIVANIDRTVHFDEDTTELD